eukprot:TRINITY_DN11070_c0_g1_i3.p1 TRINITY_DN11070_c0_g1~~TRINITY_DN11070_c0_g1_i3.p1  ORF type:complete len:289 (+),score=46.99 TRINITY_DN11070_c0_g1_i3:165-1031(+)
MASCRHLSRVSEALVCESVWDPTLWKCQECGTTDDVWVCLICAHRGCGRQSAEKHASKHAEGESHPLAIEINSCACHWCEALCWCEYGSSYICDDYVINDNRRGSLAKIRAVLTETATGAPPDSCTRQGKLIRKKGGSKYDSVSNVLHCTSVKSEHKAFFMDKMSTSLKKWSLFQQHLALKNWCLNSAASPHDEHTAHTALDRSPSVAWSLHRTAIKRGRTGLRNIGNTCYLNAVVQALSHIRCFRNMFYAGMAAQQVVLPELQRTATLDCLQAVSYTHLTLPTKRIV